jgi:hypothetical protein
MIHEFAVEPEVAATWEHFRVLWPGIGVGAGRFLVEYPGKWRKRVYELADQLSKPVHAHSIKSKLGDAALRRAKLVGASGRDFDGGDWLSNAIRHQVGERRFRAIVARSNAGNRADVLLASEFDPDSEPWRVITQQAIHRNARAMCAVAEPLLRHSDELALVDRHFNPHLPRYRRPFKAFVRVRPQWKRLEIHTTTNANVLPADYQRLSCFLPRGTMLTVLLWPSFPAVDALHARYILTERGGIGYDWGLDEGQSPDQMTEVRLVEHERYLELRDQHHRAARVFGTPQCLEVGGGD